MRVHDGAAADLPAVGARGRRARAGGLPRSWPTTAGTAVWRRWSASPTGQLDIRQMPWRLHVFTPVLGIPGVAGPGTVVVMQVPHAVADGVRAAAMAAWLFGRDVPVPELARPPAGFFPWRAFDAGARPSPAGSRSPRRAAAARGRGCGRRWRPTPDRTAPARCARWCDTAAQLTGPDGHRRGAGGGVHGTVPAARRVRRFAGCRSADGQTRCCHHAHNHFGNVAVGLYPGLDCDARVAADRDRFGQWPPSLRASGYPLSRPRLRRGTRAAIALGRLAVRPRCPAGAGRRQHRGVQH